MTAQNGIQIGYGAAGSVTDCDVSGMDCTPTSWTACGLLLYPAGTVTMSGWLARDRLPDQRLLRDVDGSTVTDLDRSGGGGVGHCDSSAHSQATWRDGGTGARPRTAAGAAVRGSQVGSSGPLGRRPPCSTWRARRLPRRPRTSRGLERHRVWSAGGGLSVLARPTSRSRTGTTPSWPTVRSRSWRTTTPSPRNLSAGFDNTAASQRSAERGVNWWGNVGGPGVGGANPVVGPNVDYTPWLIAGTDLEPACGFSAPLDNLVAPVAPASALRLRIRAWRCRSTSAAPPRTTCVRSA